jgi:hypothetical protein
MAFVAKRTINYLKQNGIRYYFKKFKYTNRNRVVDRVIRTIRDIIVSLLQRKHKITQK